MGRDRVEAAGWLAQRVLGRARRTVAGAHRRLGSDTDAVALTFDDGPSAQFTPQVLDLLAEARVRATFFVVGQAARDHPALLRRIVAEGHGLGSHSYSHPDPWTLPLCALAADYRKGRGAAEEAAKRQVRLFRPPKGYLDWSGVMAIRACGLQPWLWSIDSYDWRPGATADGIVERARTMRPGDVFLLHDGLWGPNTPPEALDRSATVDALPEVIRAARHADLELVPLSLG